MKGSWTTEESAWPWVSHEVTTPMGLLVVLYFYSCSGRHRRGVGTTVDLLCIGPMRTFSFIKVR